LSKNSNSLFSVTKTKLKLHLVTLKIKSFHDKRTRFFVFTRFFFVLGPVVALN
jgi:hypothetical protein